MNVDIDQIKSSGIIKDFENIIFAEPTNNKERGKGVILLTNLVFYFLTKPSLFSKGYIVDFSFDLKNIIGVSTKGLVSKSLIVQNRNFVNIFNCSNAENLAKKILLAKKARDEEARYYQVKKEINKAARYCVKCGRKIPFDAYICPYCGAKFEENLGNKTDNDDKKTYVDNNGYLRFKDTKVLVHRWIMEKHTGRKLKPWEVVHHIDGNKLNNNIENLRIMTGPKSRELHTNIHQKQKEETGNWNG